MDMLTGGLGTMNSTLACAHPDARAWAMDGLLVLPVLLSMAVWLVSKLSHDFFLASTGAYVHFATLLVSAWQVMERRTHPDPFCTGFSVYTFPSGVLFVPWLVLAITWFYIVYWRRRVSAPLVVVGLVFGVALSIVAVVMDLAAWWEALLTVAVACLVAWPFVAVMRYSAAEAFVAAMHVPWVARMGLGNNWAGGHLGVPVAAGRPHVKVVYATSWTALLYFGSMSPSARLAKLLGGERMVPLAHAGMGDGHVIQSASDTWWQTNTTSSSSALSTAEGGGPGSLCHCSPAGPDLEYWAE